MRNLAPYVREAGAGPAVVCLHSNASSSSQWRALMAALTRPDRVRALAVYEPTLFALLEEEAPRQQAANGIRLAAADAAAAIAAGDHDAAAQRFIDYWMGPGTWRRMPAARQTPIAASMVNVAGWATALFCEPTPLRAFAALNLPVLYLLGARSPASSRGVARLLTQTLTKVSVIEFAELGHMGPVTHPDLVNDALAGFLACH